MCGFSARTCAALTATKTEFSSVDVLADPRIRQELSSLSNWPTIPQLFVRGELVGGADIVGQMYESGELAAVLGADASATAEPLPETSAPGEVAPIQIENRLG
jgi:monothiol glutaredoxin